MKKIYPALVSLVVISPLIVRAEDVKDFKGLVTFLVNSINLVIPLIFGIAVLYFMYGVLKYVIASDIKSKADGRTFIIYGIIGIAVMLSVWGLAYFVKNSFFPTAPTTPTGFPKAG